MRQFGYDLGIDFDSFYNVIPHITDIWQYALSKNRFELEKGIIHPFWQLLHGLNFGVLPCVPLDRSRKVSPINYFKNMLGAFGNQLSLWSKQNLSLRSVLKQLKHLSYYDDLLNYFYHKGYVTKHAFYRYIYEELRIRRLRGAVPV
jgi:hypothetical protein